MPKIIKVGCSEYKSFFLCDDKKVYASIWGGNPPDKGQSASYLQPYPPVGVIDISGGQYQGICVDGAGFVWVLSNNAATGKRVDSDAAGLPFSGNVKCYAYMGTNLSIKSDGSVWAWGSNDYKFPGVSVAPIQISPKGIVFSKIVTGSTLIGLTTIGDVYEWTNGNIVPLKKNLPSIATDIFSSYQNFKGAIVGGNPYAWGNLNFISTVNSITSTPTNLQQVWGLKTAIKKIEANWNTLHFIDANNDLYGLGDNAQGEVGNGYEKVNKSDLVPNPYVWDWKILGGPMELKPVKMASSIADIFTGNSYTFYCFAIGLDGSVFSWGRNKSVVLGNGKAVNNESAFPNALDVLSPTKVDPFNMSTRGVNFAPYSINADLDQSITSDSVTLKGSAVAATGYNIVSLIWSLYSGPKLPIIASNLNGTALISGLINGNYVFQLTMQDNNGGRISKTVNINVAIPVNIPPSGNIGADQIVTLPINKIILDASGSIDSDGSITAYLWEKVSGPCGDSLDDFKSQKPTLTVINPGIYLYKLTVQDNKGGISEPVTTRITVNPVPYITKVEIYYSDGRIVSN